jgi:DNA-directed RNA polymerase delta subunit
MGLVSWPQIHPKGVRDKAYLVIKKAGNPQHFSQIAKLINQAKFDTKKVNVQTVHNELIKDKRFVLVGRGMYALAEWGYKAGTVKDVLTDILRTHGKPLPRADLVTKVKDVRLVKENTILLNLQDSSTFVRDGNGHYVLRKK